MTLVKLPHGHAWVDPDEVVAVRPATNDDGAPVVFVHMRRFTFAVAAENVERAVDDIVAALAQGDAHA